MRRFVLAAFALTVLAACQPAATELTEEQKAELETTIRALDDELLATVSDTDSERFLSYFEQGEDLTFALEGVVYRSWSTWADDFLRPGLAQLAEAGIETCEWSDQFYQVLSSDVVVSTAVVRCFGPATDGNPTLVDHTWTAVWTHRDEQWRIVNFSEALPPTETEG